MAEGGEIPRSHDTELPREFRDDHDFESRPDKHLYQANPLNEDEYREMRSLFRPVLCLMAILGLFHPSRNACSEETPERYRYKPFWRWLTLILSLCNIGYMLANLIVLIVAHPMIDIHSFTATVYIILMVWLGTAIVLAGLQFLICESPNRFDRIWRKWAYWARIPRNSKNRRNWGRMKTTRTIYIILAIMTVAVPTVIVPIAMNNERAGSGIEEFLKPILVGTTEINHVYWTINFTFLTFCIFGTVCFTSVFFVTHCLVLAAELGSLYRSIAHQLDTGRLWDVVKEENEEVSILEQMRRRRLECREIIEAADGTFEEIAFFSVFANVPLIVFIAYGLVSYTEQTEFKKAMGVIALLGALIQVLVVTIAAAWVHEYAAAPKRKLHTLKVHNYMKITRTNMVSLSLFLSELTSESVGITAWTFAIITKEFIATVIGLAVSYIIILVEFRHVADVLRVTEHISEIIHAGGLQGVSINTTVPEDHSAPRPE